jgi:hypothetical protein
MNNFYDFYDLAEDAQHSSVNAVVGGVLVLGYQCHQQR